MAEQIEADEKLFVIRTIRDLLPDAVILSFGSRITGRAKKYSDLDIAIRTVEPIPFRSLSKIKEAFSRSKLPFKVDLLDYNSVGSDFQKIIDSTSVEWDPPSSASGKTPKKHPWRQCPPGQHWVGRHFRHYPKKSSTPERLSDVDGHCAFNPSHRDLIKPEEIRLISAKFMSRALGQIGQFKRKPGRVGWNSLDALITGWTKYWNETLNPDQKLSPNIIKALIASESSFNRNPTKNRKTALGLIQLKEDTIKILGGRTPDLKDHLVVFEKSDVIDESVAIAAGVRWLFEKRRLASAVLNRPSSWREAVANYKGYLPDIRKGKPAKGMNIFDSYLEELEAGEH